MSEKLTFLILDADSGQLIEQELSSEEIAEREEQHLASQAEKRAKEEARSSAIAKLAALGLTEEEIAAL